VIPRSSLKRSPIRRPSRSAPSPISAKGVQIWYVATTIHWRATFATNTWKVTALGALLLSYSTKPYKVDLSRGISGQGPNGPDLTIKTGSDLNNVDFKNPFRPDAQQSEPMDHTETLEDVHLDPQTPTGPKIWREAAQPGRAQHSPFNYATDKRDLSQIGRKRRHSPGRIPWRGGDFVDWITAEDGHPMAEVFPRILRDRREGNIPVDDFSDCSDDDEDDINETQRDDRPNKRQRNGKALRNSRGASGRGRQRCLKASNWRASVFGEGSNHEPFTTQL